MKLFRLFIDAAPHRVFLSITLGAFAGISYSMLIPLVMASITPEDPMFTEVQTSTNTLFSFEVSNYHMATIYLIACVLILFARSLSEIVLLHVGAIVARDIRTDFYKRINSAPMSSLEKIGDAKLIASVNIDVPRITQGARQIPAVFVNLITLIGMLGFLMYLNMDIFKLVIISIFTGIFIYQFPMMVGRRIFEKNREINDKLQHATLGLISGQKELKLDSEKRNNYLNRVLLQHEKDLVRTESMGYTVTRSTVSLGDLLSFFVIGSITFIFVNYYDIPRQELAGIIMALLYITTPIAIVLNSIPGLTVASVSFRKVKKLLSTIPKEDIADDIKPLPQWQSIHFKNIEYHYSNVQGEKGFAIGPMSFTLNKGEVTCIIGGNGSGKSTLSKLITQHYQPNQGKIYIDEQEITKDYVCSLRNQIHAIYTDYHLFDELLIEVTPETEDRIRRYLKEFRLDTKVTIINGLFSTTKLSDGQRKRLALLIAFLEDKEMYLFDEWAADQDPDFKHIFYTEILPELKALGKAVVIISHDDRYFSVADKLLRMDNGQLTENMVSDQWLSASTSASGMNQKEQSEVLAK
ncbi:cyclic peptide export ABC transporter [Pseudoalteromonas sp. OANN1]|uniref:cyclic peptide export ABC transporter n=1 Tax=Pseudoalteromonas sp. OANN1 TaxID=2954497 RepID=UPI0020986285|nr:cyclic peptide export ABC transporter [Pseudoalteromonas sp. OANN1]MCO7199081.1 cyclic peptide export ABC transporter [Pseudoalteromonas sp. OANN1]